MDAIYQQAQLTIIAAAGADPDFGLPGVGKRARDVPSCAQIGRDNHLVIVDYLCQSFCDSIWTTRGWTYQESVFSRRCIIFTEKEILFQCKSMCCRETVCPADQMNIFTYDGASIFDPQNLTEQTSIWTHIEAYSQRTTSFDSDALNGMLGIFRSFRKKEDPTYHLQGIPFSGKTTKAAQENFLAGLCWGLSLKAGLGRRRPGFPSWSWTGCELL